MVNNWCTANTSWGKCLLQNVRSSCASGRINKWTVLSLFLGHVLYQKVVSNKTKCPGVNGQGHVHRGCTTNTYKVFGYLNHWQMKGIDQWSSLDWHNGTRDTQKKSLASNGEKKEGQEVTAVCKGQISENQCPLSGETFYTVTLSDALMCIYSRCVYSAGVCVYKNCAEKHEIWRQSGYQTGEASLDPSPPALLLKHGHNFSPEGDPMQSSYSTDGALQSWRK